MFALGGGDADGRCLGFEFALLLRRRVGEGLPWVAEDVSVLGSGEEGA
jgi:hypothetical protein